MTEKTTTEESTTDEAVSPTEAASDAAEPEAETIAEPVAEEPLSGNKEAAKYRRQARDAEAERDQLRDWLTESRRIALAAHPRSKFFADGSHQEVFADPDALFDPKTGQIDQAKYDAHFEAVKAQRPYLMHRLIIPAEGGSPPGQYEENSWEKAFKTKE